jgi:predicted Fe-Mo cluster-binding NifX family protein
MNRTFGRAQKFMIYETDNDTFEMVDNIQNLNAAQGAGIQSAKNVAQSGAKALICENCGPKAFQVLTAAGVEIYIAGAGKVSDLIEKFKKGELKTSGGANVQGHWL